MAIAVAAPSDEAIQRDVLTELKWDAKLAPNDIGVTVKDGVVTLTGTVSTFSRRAAAERAALRVRGVRGVANEIELELSPGDEVSDTDIAESAARALALDSLVPDDAVKVSVSQGRVVLHGQVDWQYQRREAERVVRTLRGVRGVSNQITLRPRTAPAADELKQRIEDALVRSAELDSKQITVISTGNRVVLEGTVRSWTEREEAERVAWLAPGVTEVENRIRLRS
jgi:osmotically-inducible protein OsmY